jgi:heat shock protein HslJ
MQRLTPLAVILAISMFSCLTPIKNPNPLKGTKWTLTGLPNDSFAFPAGFPELAFGDTGVLGGYTGCNQFFGTYVLKNDSTHTAPKSIQLMVNGMTKKYCMDVNEQGFLTMLSNAENYNLVHDSLMLYHGGKKSAVFKLKQGN